MKGNARQVLTENLWRRSHAFVLEFGHQFVEQTIEPTQTTVLQAVMELKCRVMDRAEAINTVPFIINTS